MREKMKTLLLASTALVATAGFAAADVKISGYAEIGIIGGDAYTDSRTQYHTDIDVTFSMTGESDGGLAFGASIDLDEADDSAAGGSLAFGNTTQGGETYFLSYGSLRLDMGDTDSAYDAAMQEVALAGASIADDETTHAGYNGNSGMDGIHGGQIARVSYSASGLTVGVSAAVADSDAGNDNPALAIGAAYTADMGGTSVTVGGGYITQEDNADMLGISVKAAMAGGFSVGVNFSEMDYAAAGLENQTHMAIGVGYSMDALSIGLNYGVYNDHAGVDGDEDSGFGVAATYDLGGGLAAHFGYGNSTMENAGVETDSDSYSLGLSMSF
ncbi:porin [Marivita cryptomonadis]|uniref:porin n=1 Tax=Marivita cryptomonadis TaxID=505252 RepID=UPI00391B8DE4